MASQVFTVRELVAYIQVSLENDQLLRDVWLSGEVAEYSRSAAGHSYFTLRDGERASATELIKSSLGAVRAGPTNSEKPREESPS